MKETGFNRLFPGYSEGVTMLLQLTVLPGGHIGTQNVLTVISAGFQRLTNLFLSESSNAAKRKDVRKDLSDEEDDVAVRKRSTRAGDVRSVVTEKTLLSFIQLLQRAQPLRHVFVSKHTPNSEAVEAEDSSVVSVDMLDGMVDALIQLLVDNASSQRMCSLVETAASLL